MAKPLTLDELTTACRTRGVEWPTSSADAPFTHDSISVALHVRSRRLWAAFHAYWKERGLTFYEEHYGAPLGFVLERANRVVEALDWRMPSVAGCRKTAPFRESRRRLHARRLSKRRATSRPALD